MEKHVRSASIIHESYVSEIILLQEKSPRISGPQWLDLFLRHARPKLRLKCQNGSYFCAISCDSQKSNYDVIFGRDLLRKLEIQLDFQNNFIGWKDVNLPMKPIDCKMRTHFTIQDSKNVRNATNRIKKILDANYKIANLKKIANKISK